MSDDRLTLPADVAAGDERADHPTTVLDMLERLDHQWRSFRALVDNFPRERIDEPIGRGWTRKHMLAHVGAWHDASTARLLALAKTGEPQPITDDTDAFNARVARAAAGRTSGEVIDSLDASFNRLRRQISQLTDEQLAVHAGWAVQVIASNTYDHYDEHAAELQAADISSSA